MKNPHLGVPHKSFVDFYFQAIRKCLDLLTSSFCYSAPELKAFEAEADRGADEMRPSWELLTNQLGVELPDLGPCFKISSADVKSGNKKTIFASSLSLLFYKKLHYNLHNRTH